MTREQINRRVKKNVVAIHLNVYGFLMFCVIIHKAGVAFAVVALFIFSVVAEFSLL